MPPTRFKRSRRPRLNKTRKVRKSPTVSRPVRQYVNKAIHGNISNRRWVDFSASANITTAGAGSTPTNISLLPYNLVRDANDNGRTGNTIKIVKAYCKGFVNLLPYSATTNPKVAPLMVKMWVLSCKDRNTYPLTNTNISTNFFDAGANASGFQGNLLDMTLPQSKETYVIHYMKSFKLGLGSGTTAFPSTNVQVNDNSSFNKGFYFNYGKKFKSQIKYLDSSGFPANRNCFLAIQCVYADGTSSAITPAAWSYTTVVEYEMA